MQWLTGIINTPAGPMYTHATESGISRLQFIEQKKWPDYINRYPELKAWKTFFPDPDKDEIYRTAKVSTDDDTPGSSLETISKKNKHVYQDSLLLNKNFKAIFKKTTTQLHGYFRNELQTFNIPLDYTGTRFNKSVWNELRKIPFGELTSYGKIAHALDNPGAGQAVGQANRKNPIAIVIPCHRVIGKGDRIMGYASGLHRKAMLLEHEGCTLRL